MEPKAKLNLDIALEEIAKKVRPIASVYTVNPSNCGTENCSPQCECCSEDPESTCHPQACPENFTCAAGC